MGAAFLYDSFSDTAVLSGGSYVAGLPLSNVQNSDITHVARTVSAEASATWMEARLGKDRPVGGIVIGPTNISPGASYRIRAYGGSPEVEVHDSGILTRPGSRAPMYTYPWGHPALWSGIDATEVDTGDVIIVELLPPGLFIARIVIEIFDEGNGRGHLDFGRLIIGRVYRPEINYSYGSNGFTIETLTDVEESLGGAKYYWRRGDRRLFRCVFDHAREPELFGDVYRMMETLGIDGQMFFMPDPDDAENFQKRSFFATFRQMPAIDQSMYRRGTTAFDLEEVL